MSFKPIDVYSLETGRYENGERVGNAYLATRLQAGKAGWQGFMRTQRRLSRDARAKSKKEGAIIAPDDKRSK